MYLDHSGIRILDNQGAYMSTCPLETRYKNVDRSKYIILERNTKLKFVDRNPVISVSSKFCSILSSSIFLYLISALFLSACIITLCLLPVFGIKLYFLSCGIFLILFFLSISVLCCLHQPKESVKQILVNCIQEGWHALDEKDKHEILSILNDTKDKKGDANA